MPFPITTEAYVARSSGTELGKVTYDSLGDHELLVEVVAVSICHTDIKTAAGEFRLKPPLILGHEGSGYVREVGKSVIDVQPGDAVVLAYTSCGKCRRCLSGKQPYCDELTELNFKGCRGDVTRVVKGPDGKDVNGLFFGQSSMSRLALVHENSAVKIECTKEELKLVAGLGCGIQTGADAILNVAKPPPASSIAIFGGGAVGLSAILAAKLLSPGLLVLVDNSQAKLDMIPKELLDGVHVIKPSGHQPGETSSQLKALTPSHRGTDFTLDCIGNEAVIIEAHSSLDKLGTLINVGSSATAKAGFSIGMHILQGATVRGTHQGDSVSRVTIPYMVGLWKQGKFPFDKLLTQHGFAELDKVLEDMHARRVVKPLLVI